MKKRMLLLGLGLAVVGTGIIVNKLRKRNNEVEETTTVETVEENNEVEETVEVNEEEITTVETVEENNELEEMVNMVNEMSKEEVENMVENIMEENKVENEICADEEPKMSLIEKARMFIDEQISKINMSKETKMNLITISASVIIAALIMRFSHYMIKGAMFIGLVVVIKDTIDRIDINLGEVK